MVSVGVHELKNNLSRYLDRVQAGETVVVTDRGKPVARIEGFQQEQLPEFFRQLVEAGLARDPGPLRVFPSAGKVDAR